MLQRAIIEWKNLTELQKDKGLAVKQADKRSVVVLTDRILVILVLFMIENVIFYKTL